MSWNYAELSSEAKKAGGPEALMEILIQSGRDDMKPVVVLAGLIGAGLGVCVTTIICSLKQKCKDRQKAVEQAKKQLIQGIEEYDREYKRIHRKTEKEDDEE